MQLQKGWDMGDIIVLLAKRYHRPGLSVCRVSQDWLGLSVIFGSEWAGLPVVKPAVHAEKSIAAEVHFSGNWRPPSGFGCVMRIFESFVQWYVGPKQPISRCESIVKGSVVTMQV